MILRLILFIAVLLASTQLCTAQRTSVFTTGKLPTKIRYYSDDPIFPLEMVATLDGGYLISYEVYNFRDQEYSSLTFGIVKIASDRRIEWSRVYDLGPDMQSMEPVRILPRDDGTFALLLEINRSGFLNHSKQWEFATVVIDSRGSVISGVHYPMISKTPDVLKRDDYHWLNHKVIDVAPLGGGSVVLRDTPWGFSLLWFDERGVCLRSVNYSEATTGDQAYRSSFDRSHITPRAIAIDSTGKIVVLGTYSAYLSQPLRGIVMQFDHSGEVISAKLMHSPLEHTMTDLLILPNGSYLAAGSSRSRAVVFSPNVNDSSDADDIKSGNYAHWKVIRDSTLGHSTFWTFDSGLTTCRSTQVGGRSWNTELLSAQQLSSGDILLTETAPAATLGGTLSTRSPETPSDGYLLLSKETTFIAQMSLSVPERKPLDTIRHVIRNEEFSFLTLVARPQGRIELMKAVAGADNTALFFGKDYFYNMLYTIHSPGPEASCLSTQSAPLELSIVDVSLIDIPLVCKPYRLQAPYQEINLTHFAFPSPFMTLCE